MKKNITCIYHKDCIDGTAAAAVVLKKFPHAQTFPLAHNYTPEEIETILDVTDKNAHIYIVDSTLGLSEFLERGYIVTIIDHHISERARVTEILNEYTSLTYIFDNTKSGASLSWSYLFPEEQAPLLIPFIEDGDLWKKEFGEETEQVTNYVSLWNNDPHKVQELFDTEISEIKNTGAIITNYVHTQVGKFILTGSNTLKIGNHEVLAYNITDHQSACGNTLSKENDAAVALYTIIGSEVKMSFRSLQHQEPSALKLAMTLGGGGHRNSSGATIPFQDFLQMIIV